VDADNDGADDDAAADDHHTNDDNAASAVPVAGSAAAVRSGYDDSAAATPGAGARTPESDAPTSFPRTAWMTCCKSSAHRVVRTTRTHGYTGDP
jgi:hypothetical protein